MMPITMDGMARAIAILFDLWRKYTDIQTKIPAPKPEEELP
jgi:hypothetical protein